MSVALPETETPDNGLPDGAWLGSRLAALHGGRHFALAVSGGPDSMALLALAAEAQARTDISFSVLTVNHGLRAAAADEAAMVRQCCFELGLAHFILQAETPLSGSGLQEKARLMRYALMAEWCHNHQADGLVLAHHASDQAETLLMRLARRSGLDGLAGMAERQTFMTAAGSILLLRPLLTMPKTTLAAILARAGLPAFHDPSNQDDRFERVRWRRALSAQNANGAMEARLSQLARRLRKRRNHHDARDLDWLQTHASWHDYGVLRVSRQALAALPAHRQIRLLRSLLGWIGQRPYPPKRDKCRYLPNAVEAKPSSGLTLAGCALRWRGGDIFIGREKAALAGVKMPVGDAPLLWDGRFIVHVAAAQNGKGLFVAPLGAAGLELLAPSGAAARDGVNAAYLHVLPAFFDDSGLLACPLLQQVDGFHAVLADGLADFTGLFPDRSGW